MSKVKLQWEVPNYFPLRQAIVKSGSIYTGDGEGVSVQITTAQQYTNGGMNFGFTCSVVDVTSTFTAEANGNVCFASINFDMSINYCSTCSF